MCVWKNVFDFFFVHHFNNHHHHQLFLHIGFRCVWKILISMHIYMVCVCAWMRGPAQFFFFTFLVAARYLPFSSYTHHNLRYFPFGGYVIKFVRFWCALLKYLPFHWITCALWISKLINTFKYMFLWMFFVSFVQFILISDFLSLSFVNCQLNRNTIVRLPEQKCTYGAWHEQKMMRLLVFLSLKCF